MGHINFSNLIRCQCEIKPARFTCSLRRSTSFPFSMIFKYVMKLARGGHAGRRYRGEDKIGQTFSMIMAFAGITGSCRFLFNPI